MLTSIRKAITKDAALLAQIGSLSFIQSHGHSASEEVVRNYVKEKFNQAVLSEELNDPQNIYYIIFVDDRPVGYSKIVLSAKHPEILVENITKLERLYLLKDVYGLKVGGELFRWNVDLSKKAGEAGMWLYTWKENLRAINFYQKNGFVIIGSYDFALSPTHSNPNHVMFLKY